MNHLTTYEHRVSSILPNRLISPTCQPTMTVIITNKANLPDVQMNVSTIITKNYENKSN
jgi:hypothetical protein